jgi:hypothetical protein
MPLSEASFRAATGRRYRLRVADILTSLDEADRATLARVLADRNLSHESIARTLRTEKIDCSGSAVRTYRMRELGWQD